MCRGVAEMLVANATLLEFWGEDVATSRGPKIQAFVRKYGIFVLQKILEYHLSLTGCNPYVEFDARVLFEQVVGETFTALTLIRELGLMQESAIRDISLDGPCGLQAQFDWWTTWTTPARCRASATSALMFSRACPTRRLR
jgi:hypothetical protein